MTTAHDVAKFMAEELERSKFLHQETVVHQITQKFGRGFTGINANGNPSINKDVLSAFNKLTPDAVWDRAELGARVNRTTGRAGNNKRRYAIRTRRCREKICRQIKLAPRQIAGPRIHRNELSALI